MPKGKRPLKKSLREADRRATNAKSSPVHFGPTGKAVRVPTTTLRKSKAENRRLYEDLSLGPPGSKRGGGPKHPRKKR